MSNAMSYLHGYLLVLSPTTLTQHQRDDNMYVGIVNGDRELAEIVNLLTYPSP